MTSSSDSQCMQFFPRFRVSDNYQPSSNTSAEETRALLLHYMYKSGVSYCYGICQIKHTGETTLYPFDVTEQVKGFIWAIAPSPFQILMQVCDFLGAAMEWSEPYCNGLRE